MTNMRLRTPSTELIVLAIFAELLIGWVLAPFSPSAGFWMGTIFLGIGCILLASWGIISNDFGRHLGVATFGFVVAVSAHFIVFVLVGAAMPFISVGLGLAILYAIATTFSYIIRLKFISRR